MALNLRSPWQVEGIDFKPGVSGHDELHICIGFIRGSRFADQCGEPCTVHDTVERSWQHLTFLNIPVTSIAACRASRPVQAKDKLIATIVVKEDGSVEVR